MPNRQNKFTTPRTLMKGSELQLHRHGEWNIA